VSLIGSGTLATADGGTAAVVHVPFTLPDPLSPSCRKDGPKDPGNSGIPPSGWKKDGTARRTGDGRSARDPPRPPARPAPPADGSGMRVDGRNRRVVPSSTGRRSRLPARQARRRSDRRHRRDSPHVGTPDQDCRALLTGRETGRHRSARAPREARGGRPAFHARPGRGFTDDAAGRANGMAKVSGRFRTRYRSEAPCRISGCPDPPKRPGPTR